MTHTGTFSTVDANNLVYFEFRTSAFVFFYSGSVTACKMTEWKPYYQNKWRKYFPGNAWWYKSHQVPSLWQLAVFKVGSDMVQLCYPGSGFSRNSCILRNRRRRKKSRILWGCRRGCREGLYRKNDLVTTGWSEHVEPGGAWWTKGHCDFGNVVDVGNTSVRICR